MHTSFDTKTESDYSRSPAMFIVVGAVCIVLVFTVGWFVGSSTNAAIDASMAYPQRAYPEHQYVIDVEVDPSFYSFYDAFGDADDDAASVANLQQR